MHEKYVPIFFDAIKNVMEQFGISGISLGKVESKARMTVDKDITAILGLVGDVRGNIAFSLSKEAARSIVSTMMMGMPVEEIDEMGRSAIGEFSNMIAGSAVTVLADSNIKTDITSPSLIFGSDIYFIISSIQSTMVLVDTAVGGIEINIGLEI